MPCEWSHICIIRLNNRLSTIKKLKIVFLGRRSDLLVKSQIKAILICVITIGQM